MTPPRRRAVSRLRRFLRRLVIALAVIAAASIAAQAPFIYRRFYVYPRMQAALDAIERSRAPSVSREDGLTDFRGVLHVHSYLSHDSMGTPAEMIAAARSAGIDFIFTTDHYGWATDAHVISQALRGEHGGIFFVAGAEMRDGVMPFFLDRPPASYDPHQPLQGFVDDLREKLGAVVFFTHPDDPRRRWDVKGWTGMEIYNLHADARQAKLGPYFLFGEQVWSMRRYPMRVFHQLFREPRAYLKLYDGFTRNRRVVAVAGNDAHQNNGLRLIVDDRGQLVLTDTSGAERSFWIAGRIGRTLARLRWGELKPGRTLWRVDADLYERSFRFVNTHLLAKAKTEEALRNALVNGHAYVAFDSLVTATGFDFFAAHGGQRQAIMGGEMTFQPGLELEVRAPADATLRLLRSGRVVAESRGRRLRFSVPEAGVFRAEAHLSAQGKLLPWIYSNCVYIR